MKTEGVSEYYRYQKNYSNDYQNEWTEHLERMSENRILKLRREYKPKMSRVLFP
jgi:hypothetical protein